MTSINQLNILKKVLKSKSHSEDGINFEFTNIKITSFGPDNFSMYFSADCTVPENMSWSWILLSSYIWGVIDYYSQLTSTVLWGNKVKVNTEIDNITVNGEKISSKSYHLNDEAKSKMEEIINRPLRIKKEYYNFSFEVDLKLVSYDVSFDDNVYMNVNYEIPEIILIPKNFDKKIKITSLSENIVNAFNFYLTDSSNSIENKRHLMEDEMAGQVMNDSLGLNYRSDSYLNLYINVIKICNKEVKWIGGEKNEVIKYFEDVIERAKNKLSESFNYFRN